MNPETCSFKNPFDDYTPELAATIFDSNGKIKKTSPVRANYTARLEACMEKLKKYSSGDYTVYTGTLGYALLKFKLNSTEKGNLSEIRRLLSTVPIKPPDKDSPSFLLGASGPLALEAVVCYQLQDRGECLRCIFALQAIGQDVIRSKDETPNELLYGKAGYLYSLLFVNKYCTPPMIDQKFIRKIVDVILSCGRQWARDARFKCPLMYYFHNAHYLGAAHGVAGILYMLLQSNCLTQDELTLLIKPTIDYLTSLRFSKTGNFPIAMEDQKDYKVQWCHGAPGFVYLYSMAYKVFGNAEYLTLALECGETIWRWGLLRKGYSLCHGVAGNGYGFLELYQLTKHEKHLYRAMKFAEWCVNYSKTCEEYSPDHPFSLFEGICGPMYFILDILNPMEAKFPGFTL